ncbi:hypothetical protein [Bradyrhizobium zhanjiangense]|uniref:Uncharacterized protein n=1 Tax=Bradyrhizobium zhanjiangense TaxID=1325107 RepID=A0A4Q0SRP2_9BRAD|nr:hypothetical protein [Bradyrhizobium zhanjiangense]RXH41348.1 hypothetical protein XH94_08295 [Bradyrhizobium zhanjiangense]
MSDVRVLLIRGSEKVIGHYRLLLASAKTESERQLYRSRIEREQRLLDELLGGFPDRFAASSFRMPHDDRAIHVSGGQFVVDRRYWRQLEPRPECASLPPEAIGEEAPFLSGAWICRAPSNCLARYSRYSWPDISMTPAQASAMAAAMMSR